MVNRVVLIGNIVRDAELQKTGNGVSVCQFVLAVNKRDRESAPNYINCVAWRQSAEYLGQYAKKGDTISVDGSLSTRSYEAKDGTKRYVTEVIGDNVSIVRRKNPVETAHAQQAEEPQWADEPSIEITSEDLPF